MTECQLFNTSFKLLQQLFSRRSTLRWCIVTSARSYGSELIGRLWASVHRWRTNGSKTVGCCLRHLLEHAAVHMVHGMTNFLCIVKLPVYVNISVVKIFGILQKAGINWDKASKALAFFRSLQASLSDAWTKESRSGQKYQNDKKNTNKDKTTDLQSNLNTVSKIIERLALSKLRQYLIMLTGSPSFNLAQSTYRRSHSIKPVLHRTIDFAHRTINCSEATMLVALDISAVFDMAVHWSLLHGLSKFWNGRPCAEVDHVIYVRMLAICSNQHSFFKIDGMILWIPQGSDLAQIIVTF